MVRLLAKLDIKNSDVIKPIYFEGLRRVGSSANLAKKYYDEGIDEILYIDQVASLYTRSPEFDAFEKATRDIFIPVTAGGGITNIDECSQFFLNGADKIAINTFAAQNDPNILNEAAKKFGSQSVVLNIEAKFLGNRWVCFTDGGRINSNKPVLDWALEAQDRGVGEILLQSVDKDGSKTGFEKELAFALISQLTIPVVVASGAGCPQHIVELVDDVCPSGVAISSILHDNDWSIRDVKNYLTKNLEQNL